MFITFEGLDGSGSSTHAKLLADKLELAGFPIALTKEPTNNILGGILRGALTRQIDFTPETLQLLFSADRGHHLSSQIDPWIAQGKMVICDRYIASTVAFGSLEIDDITWLQSLNERFRKPDLTFLLKVPASECIRRIKVSRPETELFEEEAKLEKIWKVYESLAHDDPSVYVIDAMQEKNKVHEVIWNQVRIILDL